jgi:hypothetical protein
MQSGGGHGLSPWPSSGRYSHRYYILDVKFTYREHLRFQRWVEHLSPPSKSHTLAKFVRNEMPPLDVWMVLHAYLLNPQLACAVPSGINVSEP